MAGRGAAAHADVQPRLEEFCGKVDEAARVQALVTLIVQHRAAEDGLELYAS